MSGDKFSKLRWRLGVLAACAMTALSLYPQLDLWRTPSAKLPGTYVTLEFDETSYSSYLNALLDGRPRRNDPYTGRDDSPTSPQPESYNSVQFVPPYLLTLPARVFGLGASTTFILLAPLAAFASTLALFWLLGLITKDDRVACAGALLVLCMGSLAGTPGALRTMLHLHNPFTLLPFLPFLRRYEPSVPFPFYLIFCAFVWRALACEDKRAAARRAVAAGVTFSVLVFSYFYLWTAAAAWLSCLALLWLIARPDRRRASLLSFGVVATCALASLVPYAVLLSHRAATTDGIMVLKASHAPDIFRLTEALGALVMLALIAAAWKGSVRCRDAAWLFAASFALLPFIVFNQQIVTGLSLQPVHYEKVIGNYSVLVAFVIAATIIWQGLRGKAAAMPRGFLMAVAVAAFCWALAETATQTSLNRHISLMRAQEQPVAARLRELARGASLDRLADQVVLFSPDLLRVHADSLPTDAPQPPLWAPHMFVYVGVTWEEYKERLYQNLYYTGIDEQKLNALLWGEGGHIRFAFTAYQSKPFTDFTIPEGIRNYLTYASTFDRERAAQSKLAYLVTKVGDDSDLSNLDRWYERDAGERVGDLMLYRLRLRE